MAVTGTGTQADPFIITDYEDFASCKGNGYGDTPTWVKLNNDIDCNDYGNDFLWYTVQLYGSAVYGESCMHVDLDGHTIKNAIVAPNNVMFDFKSTSELKNGKLRNIFLSDANSLFTSSSGIPTVENMSISTDATGLKSYLISNILLSACALFVRSYSALSTKLIVTDSDTATLLNNCDIKFEIENANEKEIIGKMVGYGGTVSKIAGCRFKGYIKGRACGSGANRSVLSRTLNSMDQCCFNVDFSEMWGDSPTVKWMVSTIISGTLNGSVVNGDLGNGYVTGNFVVNGQQIVNGDSLRSKGFVVVNVSA